MIKLPSKSIDPPGERLNLLMFHTTEACATVTMLFEKESQSIDSLAEKVKQPYLPMHVCSFTRTFISQLNGYTCPSSGKPMFVDSSPASNA